MQFIEGILLHKKQITIKRGPNQGKQISVLQILDEYPTHSDVKDVTDYDNHVNGTEKGLRVRLPIRSSAGVSDRGNPYTNFVCMGPPQELTQ